MIRKALLAGLIVTLVLLRNYVWNLNQAPDLDYHGDTAHVTLTLRHYQNLLTGKTPLKDFLEVPMFYGLPNSLLYSEPFLLHGILALPLFLLTTNVILVFNILAVLTLVASFVSMFALCEYFTHKFWPSFVGALIFTFNPFVIGRFPEHLSYYSLEWLPLIFLFLEKSLRQAKSKDIFLFFFFFTMQFLSAMTFIVLLSVILPPYLLFRWRKLRPNIRKFINRGLITGMLFFLAFLIPQATVYLHQFPSGIPDRSIDNSIYFSPWLQDFLMASPVRSFLYRGWSQYLFTNITNYLHIAGQDFVERDLFIGITPFIILCASLIILRKNSQIPWKLWGLLAIVGTLFCLGPVIHINGEIQFPGPYFLLLKIDPLLSLIRAPSRFFFISYLFIALICACGLSEGLHRLKRHTSYIILTILIALISLEYWNNPWEFTSFSQDSRQVYAIVESDSRIHAILELPLGLLVAGYSNTDNLFVDTKYMLAASTLHHKQLYNGYSSYIPQVYISRAEELTINFPTYLKLKNLERYGIDAIVLHKDDFVNPQIYNQTHDLLVASHLPKLYESPDTSLFLLNNWQPTSY